MSTSDPVVKSPDRDSAEALGTAGHAAVESPADCGSTGRAGPLVFLALGLLGGIVGGFAVDRAYGFFEAVPVGGAAGNGILTAEQLAQATAARVRADYKNAPLALGLLGLCTGICLGLAQSTTGRSISIRMLAGGLTGAVLGALGGLAAVFVREQLRDWNTLDATGQPHALLTQLHTMILQLPAWIGIAVAVGLTAGVLARRGSLVLRAGGLALVGVLLAAVLYPTLASLLFATEDSGGVVPGGMSNRIFWASLHAGLMGLIVGGFGSAALAGPTSSTVSPAAG